MILAVLAIAALEAAAAPGAGSAPAAASPPSVAAAAKARDPMVCHDEAPIGSLLKRQVCVRRSVEEARARSAQSAVDRMTTGGPVKDPTR